MKRYLPLIALFLAAPNAQALNLGEEWNKIQKGAEKLGDVILDVGSGGYVGDQRKKQFMEADKRVAEEQLRAEEAKKADRIERLKSEIVGSESHLSSLTFQQTSLYAISALLTTNMQGTSQIARFSKDQSEEYQTFRGMITDQHHDLANVFNSMNQEIQKDASTSSQIKTANLMLQEKLQSYAEQLAGLPQAAGSEETTSQIRNATETGFEAIAQVKLMASSLEKQIVFLQKSIDQKKSDLEALK